MKIYRYITIILLFILSGSFFVTHVSAQNKKDDRSLLYFIADGQKHEDIMGYFYNTKHVGFNAPDVPRFIVASRNKNFMMGIGGYVMFRMAYDIGGIVEGQDFLTYNIAVPNAGNPKSQILMDAAPSRLFTKVIANTERLGQVIGYIEADFLGKDRTLRLRHAYISFKGFTFGQTLSTFIDQSAYAPTVDQNGSIVSTQQRIPLMKYVYKMPNGLSFAAAIEDPRYSGKTMENVCETAKPAIPDFPMWVQYKNGESHIRATAILRSLQYKNILEDKYKGLFAYGFRLSGTLKVAQPLTFYYQGAYGKGVSSFILDISGKGLDLLPNPAHPGKMEAVEGMLLYGGFKYNYTKNLHSSVIYAFDRIYPNADYVYSINNGADFYKYANSASCNIIWNINTSMICGLEYWWGQRTNFDGQRGNANRIYTMIRYNF